MMRTAYYDSTGDVGDRHPGQNCTCPTCFAPAGNPCVSTVAMPGTCVSDAMPLRGLHAERVELGGTRWGDRS